GITLDTSRAREVYIKFSSRASISSIGSVELDMPVSRVIFYVVDMLTPFLLCLRDMDKLRVELYNMCNKLVSISGVYMLVYRK
ncbi:hypothetical protein GQ53DRAFT_631879, partial [Thozetella sp. PMI_491]